MFMTCTFFDERGSLATHYRFASVAAASLYTTTADMTRFLQAHLAGPQGEAPGRGVLLPQTLVEMRRPHASSFGADIWGLGTMLYAPNNSGGFVIGHDGNNEPAINTAARLDPSTGDGIIILETGNKLLARRAEGAERLGPAETQEPAAQALRGRRLRPESVLFEDGGGVARGHYEYLIRGSRTEYMRSTPRFANTTTSATTRLIAWITG